MTLKRLDIYVAVSDMEHATEFYRHVFQKEPSLVTPNYTGFELEGALFGLFRQDTYPSEHPVVRGNSTVANILVEDIDGEFDRIKAVRPRAIGGPIFTIGPYRGFVFMDPDDNLIELYEVGAD